MYADGSSYMLELLNNLSQNKIKFAVDLNHMQYIIQQLVQLPVIFAFFIGIKNKFALMGIYSMSQFLLPFLALIWHYNLTKRTGKINVFYWNLLIYCLVILPFMIFSTVETIIGVNFTFILWNYFISDIEYKKSDIVGIIFLLIIMFATYEYVIFTGIIFFISYFLYRNSEQNVLQKNTKKLIAIAIIYLVAFLYLFKNSALSVNPMWEGHFRVIPCIILPFLFIWLIINDKYIKTKNKKQYPYRKFYMYSFNMRYFSNRMAVGRNKILECQYSVS